MKCKIRHRPTDSWVRYEEFPNGFHCSLVDENGGETPTVWHKLEPRVLGLIKTCFGHSNVEVVEEESQS